MLAGPADQRPIRRDEPFLPTDRVLVQDRFREVPVHLRVLNPLGPEGTAAVDSRSHASS